MKSAQSAQAAQTRASPDTFGTNAESAIAAYADEFNTTAEDAHDWIGQNMGKFMKNVPDSHRSLEQAYKSGTLKVERLWDLGVETSQKVTLQLDQNGKQVGTSVDYLGNDSALKFLVDRMGTEDSGVQVWGTDVATGKNATWMALGNNYFYLTW